MITELKYQESVLQWSLNGDIITKKFEFVEAAICSEDQVLIKCKENNAIKVVLFSDTGARIAELLDTESLYVMYLQKHPSFGLCAVCSAQKEDGHWKDGYYAYNGADAFQRQSPAR